MSESQRSKIVREKFRSFMCDPQTQPEFLKIIKKIEQRMKSKYGKYYDVERHSVNQLLLDCVDCLSSGKRYWDYENVKIEAILYNTARSLLGNDIRKEKKDREKMEVQRKSYQSADGCESNSPEERQEIKNEDAGSYNSELNTLYDRENIGMAEKELKDDGISLKVMEELMLNDSNIEIAESLNLKVSDVENARKRIRRAGKNVLLKISGQINRTKGEVREDILKRE